MIFRAAFVAKKIVGFFSCFLLLKLVCVHSHNFSLLVCPEDTFSDGRMAGRLTGRPAVNNDNNANLSPARFS